MCGIVGVSHPSESVAKKVFFSLFALQHRGQESAGIATSGADHDIHLYKGMGLVAQVFDESHMAVLLGRSGIGHTRYSTTGGCSIQNAHPFVTSAGRIDLALAHNGNLLNTASLLEECLSLKREPSGTSDSEIMAELLSAYIVLHGDAVSAIRALMFRMRGAYCVVLLYRGVLYAFRDPHGIQPLHLGKYPNGGFVVVSEDCAFSATQATSVREIQPGECVEIHQDGSLISHQIQNPAGTLGLCFFQAVYFARPDSHIDSSLIYNIREAFGKGLAVEHPVEADIVVPVPDSGIPGAVGFAAHSGIPFGEGLTKSRYIHRTFIVPDETSRALQVRMKLSPMVERLSGKRVVLVDDSIVRGTTTGEIVRIVRAAGAKEVHVRITSPSVKHPCFYGVDMSTRDQLIAARLDIPGIARHIGADSLGFLSLEGALQAAGSSAYCTACFSGKYPICLDE